MEQPFISVAVVPTYGKLQAQIHWQTKPGFEDGKFVVLRSPDGLNDWKEIGIIERGNTLVDPDLITDGKLSILYYQVILTKLGKRYDSNVINTLGDVTREEFGAAYFIMQQEYRKLSQCTRINISKMRTTARRCPSCTDADTGQQIGISLCEVCYGTGFEGGYWPSVISFMQVLTQSPLVQVDSAEGAGSTDPSTYKCRMLAFPQLIQNDLVTDAKSDRRYLVGEAELSSLKGKIPVVATVQLTLLRHSDVRYKLAL